MNNGKVRIALVGAGNFAKAVHLENLKKLSELYHLRAVVSSTGSNAKSTAQRFGADYASTDYQDVLNDPDVDAVLICTRHHLHARMAIQAANAGKAILLEKPMALNQKELDELVGVLRKTKVPFMVGFNRRFSPATQRVKEILLDRRNPIMILYRMNAGYLPPEHWTQTAEGGGRIVGEACHIIDLFQYFIGAKALEVSSTAISPNSEHILPSDNASITIRYEEGSVATLLYTSSGSIDYPKERMELFFDGKVVVLDDYKSLNCFGLHVKGWKSVIQDKGHLEELKSFALAVNNPDLMPIDLDDLSDVTTLTFKIANRRILL